MFRDIIGKNVVTIMTREFTLDSDTITVQELIDMVGMNDHTFLPGSCGLNPEDVITAAEDGSTVVTLRFVE